MHPVQERRNDTMLAACYVRAAPEPGSRHGNATVVRGVRGPHRPPEAQRPPLAALPALPNLRWTIDGEPADTWIPTPGTHHVVVARGQTTDAIDIVYE
jgi:hypothetical protein